MGQGGNCPLAFSSMGQGGRGALFQKYNINKMLTILSNDKPQPVYE